MPWRFHKCVTAKEHFSDNAALRRSLDLVQFCRLRFSPGRLLAPATRVGHAALARTHRRDRYVPLDLEIPIAAERCTHSQSARSPEQAASNSELGAILYGAIAALPSHYRAVLELRDIHEVSTEEAAGRLQISQENVKIRLHRARAMVRKRLLAHIPAGVLGAASSREQWHPKRSCVNVYLQPYWLSRAATRIS